MALAAPGRASPRLQEARDTAGLRVSRRHASLEVALVQIEDVALACQDGVAGAAAVGLGGGAVMRPNKVAGEVRVSERVAETGASVAGRRRRQRRKQRGPWQASLEHASRALGRGEGAPQVGLQIA